MYLFILFLSLKYTAIYSFTIFQSVLFKKKNVYKQLYRSLIYVNVYEKYSFILIAIIYFMTIMVNRLNFTLMFKLKNHH